MALRILVLLFLWQHCLGDGEVNISATAGGYPFAVATVLNLTCNGPALHWWTYDCQEQNPGECFAEFNANDSARTISTLSRESVPVLTSVDIGEYTCADGNDYTANYTVSIEVSGIGVFDGVNKSTVANNSYFSADENGAINIELHCIGAYGNGSWYFEGSSVAESDSTVFFVHEEYGSSILESIEDLGSGASSGSGDGLVTIFNDTSLEGYYECHAMDEDGNTGIIRVGLLLYGRGPPEIVSVSVSDSPVDIGATVSLTCEANLHGLFLKEEVVWYRNGEQFDQGNYTISVYVSDTSVYGNYTCQVSNILGSVSKSITLERLLIAPNVTIDNDDNITVRIGDSLNITCTAVGVPTPDVRFDTDTSEDGVVIVDNAMNSKTLMISKLSAQHSGKYRCYANNTVGTDMKNFTITVQYSPFVVTALSNVTLAYIQNDSVTLRCGFMGVPPPIIVWYYQMFPINISSDKYSVMMGLPDETEYRELTIYDIVPNDAGLYTCIANNSIGSNATSANLIVNALPNVTTDDTHYIGVDGGSVNITCTVTGVPVPSLYWYRVDSGLSIIDGSLYKEAQFSGENVSTLPNGLYQVTETLLINPINISYTGVYQCAGNNALSNDEHAEFNITVQYSPIVVTALSNVTLTYIQNDTVTLSCGFMAEPPPIVVWYYQMLPINISSDKYSVMMGLPDGTEYRQLTIYDIVPKDAGLYTCIANNSIGSIGTSANLIVNAVPIVETDKTYYIGVNGGSLSVNCTVTGVPEPSLYWYRIDADSSESIVFDGSLYKEAQINSRSISTLSNGLYQVSETLLINPINVSYTGVYQCTGSNVLSSEEHAEFNITVQYTPIVYTELVSSVTAIIPNQQNVSLECSFMAEPFVNISWYKDNVLITNTVRITIDTQLKTDSDGVIVTSSTLLITDIMTQDSGRYTCNASNIIGSATSSGDLLVAVKPNVTELVSNDSTIVQPEPVRLTCMITQGHPNTNIVWSGPSGKPLTDTNQYIITNQTSGNTITSSLTIIASDPFDAGAYVCNASNFVGHDSLSIPIEVNVEPEISISPEAVTVNEFSSVEFLCSSTGIPVPSITWYRNGAVITEGLQIFNNQTPSPDTLLYQYNESFTISNVTVPDHGSYSCQVTNDVGSITKDFNLTVDYGTRLLGGISNQTISEGDTLTLNCGVEGRPHPSILWWFYNSTGYEQLTEGIVSNTNGQAVNSTLTLENTQRSYHGWFKCNSSNPLATRESQAFITVNFETKLFTSPNDQTIVSPNDLVLTCVAEGRPLPIVQWRRQDFGAISLTDNNYTITTVSEQDTVLSSTLRIHSVIPTDIGLYTCAMKNILSMVSANATLTVHVIPEIRSPSQGYEFIVNQTDTLSITCSSEGLPRPSLSWTMGGTAIPPSSLSTAVEDDNLTPIGTLDTIQQVLTINDADTVDTGDYSCTGSNVAGKDTVNFTVFVQVPPQVIPVDGDRHLISVEATSADVQFTITNAIPDVSPDDITWLFYADFIDDYPPEDAVDITGNNAPSHYTFSSDNRNLTISNINQTDEGRYYFVVRNPAGISYNHSDIIVYGPPRFVRRPEDSIIINGNSVTFVCEGVADPLHDVLWTFNNNIIISTFTDGSNKYLIESDSNQAKTYGSLTVSDVQYDDTGIYHCYLNNTVATINSPADLTVNVVPVIHWLTPSKDININNPWVLSCVVVGFPQPEITWFKNGIEIGPSADTTVTKYAGEGGQDDVQFISLIGFVGNLNLGAVARTDTAVYTCMANNIAGTNTSAVGTTVTVLERPDPPTDIAITESSVTSRGLEVTWVRPDFDGNRPITSYEVHNLLYSSNDEYQKVGEVDNNTLAYNVTGLEPYTKYTFKVVACNQIGCTMISKPLATDPIRTLTDLPETPPRDCAAITINSTSLNVMWTIPVKPNGLITYYTINYTSAGSAFSTLCTVSDSSMVTTTDNGTSLLLVGLQKGAWYSLNIKAYTSVGGGPFSTDSCTYSTAIDVPEVTPLISSIVSPSSTTLRVSWSLLTANNQACKWNGAITGYLISYHTNSGPEQNITVNDNSTMGNQLIPNLDIFTDYTVRIQVVNGAGYGESSEVSKKTLNDTSSEPRNVKGTVINDTNMVVEWVEPLIFNGIISNYQIFYQADKGDYTGYYIKEEQSNTTDTGTDRKHTLTGLYGTATYTISVAAINGAGVGTRSDSITIKTPAAPPTSIEPPGEGRNLTNPRQFAIRIQRPSDENGPLSHHQVVVVVLPQPQQPDQPPQLPSDSPDVLFPSIDSFMTYEDVIRFENSTPVAYIAAEFSDGLFPESNEYIIGDDLYNQPDDGDYNNGPLKYGSAFTFFLRTYPFTSDSTNTKRSISTRLVAGRQYTKFTSSGYLESIHSTEREPAGGSNAAVAAVVTILLLLLIAAIIVAVILGILYYKRRSRTDILEFRNTPSRNKDQSEVTSVTSDFSLSPIPSCPNPAYHEESDVDGVNQFIAGHPSIPVGEFGKIVDRLHANDNFMFSQEYDEICTKAPQPAVDVCLNPANKCRNRYANIQAYDHSRVKLIPVENHPHDYINANFLHGYNRENEYIATQGPLPDTVGDFWRMVWDHNVSTIVMLTNLVEKMRVKCSQYWPEGVGLSEQYANIRVQLTKCVTHADYCIRTFEVQANDAKEIRQVKQFHYLSWPDFGVPRHSTPLLQFLRVVRRNHKYSDTRPMIAHCSAGVGRTGTFITIDSEMQRAKHDGVLNPYSFVRSMRNNRNHMVQTEAQYIFLHDALLEVITTGWTDIGVEQLPDRMAELEEEDDQGETGYSNEFNRLKSSQYIVNEYGAAMNDANKFKNKIINALPYDHNRVKLSVVPGEPGSDYINASFIDGYKRKNVFIATQGPMENTVEDFWRMMWEEESSIIVMLCNFEERGQPICCQYLPLHAGARVVMGKYYILCTQELKMEDYTRRELKFTFADVEDKNTRIIHHYQFTTWPRTGAPSSGAGMIDMIDQVTRSQQQTGGEKPVVVHCSAGVGRTGTFCALYICIERAKLEQIFNLFDTVKHLRTQRAHMVQTLDQYVFCYRAMLEFVDSLNNYANFQTSI